MVFLSKANYISTGIKKGSMTFLMLDCLLNPHFSAVDKDRLFCSHVHLTSDSPSGLLMCYSFYTCVSLELHKTRKVYLTCYPELHVVNIFKTTWTSTPRRPQIYWLTQYLEEPIAGHFLPTGCCFPSWRYSSLLQEAQVFLKELGGTRVKAGKQSRKTAKQELTSKHNTTSCTLNRKPSWLMPLTPS